MSVVIKRSLGTRARAIALKRGIPYITAETVIKDYLKSLSDSAVNGERIVIDGLTSVSIIKNLDNGELYARGRVSTALKSKLLSAKTVVQEEKIGGTDAQ